MTGSPSRPPSHPSHRFPSCSGSWWKRAGAAISSTSWTSLRRFLSPGIRGQTSALAPSRASPRIPARDLEATTRAGACRRWCSRRRCRKPVTGSPSRPPSHPSHRFPSCSGSARRETLVRVRVDRMDAGRIRAIEGSVNQTASNEQETKEQTER